MLFWGVEGATARSIQPPFGRRLVSGWAIALTLGGLTACGGKSFDVATTMSGSSSGTSAPTGASSGASASSGESVSGVASASGVANAGSSGALPSGGTSGSGSGSSGLTSSGASESPSGSSSGGANSGGAIGSVLTDGGPGDASSSCVSAACLVEAGLEGGGETGVEAGHACTPIVHTGSMAVAYQIDPGHTGSQPNDSITVPLCERWSYDAGQPVSYALVATGRVFVTSGWDPNTSNVGVAKVAALDETTGAVLWGPVPLAGTYGYGGAAYAGGKVFVISFDGHLRALDEATGAIVWDVQLPNQYAFTSPPTAVGGTVFVSGAGVGGTLYAVGVDKGAVLWTQAVMNGDDSSPAVSSAGVFVSYACNQAYGFALTGMPLWHYSGPCEGGGGKTVALFDGSVVTRDALEGDLVLHAADGTLSGHYTSSFIPAFSSGTMFTTESGVLHARPIEQGADASTMGGWTFGSVAEPVVVAPIAVGAQLVVGTTSRVVVLDSAGGAMLSSAPLSGISTPDEQNVRVLAGLVEADGMLLVPAGSRLVAY